MESVLWLLPRFAPVWATRFPQYIGPRDFARTIAAGIIESVGFAALAPLAADGYIGEEELRVFWGICLPTGCVAVISLTCFMLLVDPYHRASFWRHESREAFFCDLWSRDVDVP